MMESEMESLDRFLEGLKAPSKETGILKVSYTHDKMIDVILSTDRITNRDLAARFGYSEAWCSTIQSSDAFRERLARRKADLTDPILRSRIDAYLPSNSEMFQRVLDRSLTVLNEKLSAPTVAISDSLVAKAIELGAKGLAFGGFSSKPAEGVRTHDSEEKLEKLADRLTGLLGQKRKEVIIDIIPQGSAE